MKTTLLILGIAAGIMTFDAAAADENLSLSPKARELRGTVAHGTDVARPFEFSRGRTVSAPNASVAGVAKDRDLIRERNTAVYTGRAPVEGSAAFEIAPVK